MKITISELVLGGVEIEFGVDATIMHVRDVSVSDVAIGADPGRRVVSDPLAVAPAPEGETEIPVSAPIPPAAEGAPAHACKRCGGIEFKIDKSGHKCCCACLKRRALAGAAGSRAARAARAEAMTAVQEVKPAPASARVDIHPDLMLAEEWGRVIVQNAVRAMIAQKRKVYYVTREAGALEWNASMQYPRDWEERGTIFEILDNNGSYSMRNVTTGDEVCLDGAMLRRLKNG